MVVINPIEWLTDTQVFIEPTSDIGDRVKFTFDSRYIYMV